MVNCKIERIGEYRNSTDRSRIINGQTTKKLNLNQNFSQINLLDGFKKFVNKYKKEKLESILAFIEQTRKPGESLVDTVNSDFVCSRGVLKTISMSNYDTKKWVFHAVRYKGVIFMCEEDTDTNNNNMSLESQKCSYYGHKFEHIMTRSDETKTYVADNGEETKSVLRASLNENDSNVQHTMFYFALFDCVDNGNVPVELKTYGGTLDKHWADNRSLLWFIQTYFANIETIYYGQRNKNILEKVFKLQTMQIPAMKGLNWNFDVCIMTLSNILTSVKTKLHSNEMACKYTFDNGKLSFEYERASKFPIVPQTFLNKFP